MENTQNTQTKQVETKVGTDTVSQLPASKAEVKMPDVKPPKPESTPKTFSNASVAEVKVKVPDVKVVGDGDTFKVLCKASSESEGWMKSTKYLEIQGYGCVLQVTTQQKNPDGSYSIAEALTTCPGVKVSHESGVPKLVTF